MHSVVQPFVEEELTEEEEKLVAELLGSFSERVHRGENVSMEDYFAQCPNDRVLREFKLVANMSQLVDIHASLQRRG